MKDADKLNAYRRAYYARNREALREKKRKWAESNRDHQREYNQEYYAAHRDEINERRKQYRKAAAAKEKEAASIESKEA